MFSKRHPRARSWAYFASTDLTRSVVETLRGYSGRWTCEVVNFYTKTHLGLADFRVRSLEGVERYVLAVQLEKIDIICQSSEKSKNYVRNYCREDNVTTGRAT